MIRRNIFSLLAAFSIWAGASGLAAADPLAELAEFSVFKNVDLGKLAGGNVLAARGPAMSSARGMAVESCYIVQAPPQKVAALQNRWDPSNHPELKVYLHADISAKPILGNFAKARTLPDNGAARSLVAATQKLNSAKPELQMSRDEAAAFAKKGGTSAQDVSAFWSNLLFQRSLAFGSGGASRQPPYFVDGATISVADEIGHLLSDVPKVRAHFKPLLDSSSFLKSGSIAPALYWELFDVDGTAAFSLGAEFDKAVGDGWQSLDAQYYASDGYFVFLTFYQIWPVTIENRPATLVWRGDLISSAELGALHGVERMGSGTAMMKEIQKSISVFLRDAASSR
ncbi:MAG: hypothetical protein M3O82_00620 [Verrucomicrobiota bacterium]|nr:hypothetical protein [Verrucomicrobiota bacterium]